MNPSKIARILTCALTTALVACGGGGGGTDGGTGSVSPSTSPVFKTYRQQVLGLIRGIYEVSCSDPANPVGMSVKTVSIDDAGHFNFSGKAPLNFDASSTVFSIDAAFFQDGISSPVSPGISMLGKSGNTSVGMRFAPSDTTGYALKELFVQEDGGALLTSCVANGAQQLKQGWAASNLFDSLTSQVNVTLRCAFGGTVTLTKTGSSLVIDSGAAKSTVNLNAEKVHELLRLPTDQLNPSAALEDSLTYSATYLNGTTVEIDLFVLSGIKRISLRNAIGLGTTTCS